MLVASLGKGAGRWPEQGLHGSSFERQIRGGRGPVGRYNEQRLLSERAGD